MRCWTFTLALLLLVGCQRQMPENTVRVQLNWLPDAQFGGYYAALIHGEYAAEGLDVEILPGGPDANVIPKLTMGRVEFGVDNADRLLLARQQGADLLAILAVMQDSPRCIMVHAGSGIESLGQLQDLTLAMGEGDAYAQFLKSKLPLQGVRVVNYSGSVAKFLLDQNYAQQAYLFSEPLVARQQGGDPQALLVSELGYNPYVGLVLAKQGLLSERPEMVAKFVRATRRGWQRYLASPDETNVHLHRLNPAMDMASLGDAIEVLRQLCVPDGMEAADFGAMDMVRWRTLAEQLIALGLLGGESVQADAAFTLRFLP